MGFCFICLPGFQSCRATRLRYSNPPTPFAGVHHQLSASCSPRVRVLLSVLCWETEDDFQILRRSAPECSHQRFATTPVTRIWIISAGVAVSARGSPRVRRNWNYFLRGLPDRAVGHVWYSPCIDFASLSARLPFTATVGFSNSPRPNHGSRSQLLPVIGA